MTSTRRSSIPLGVLLLTFFLPMAQSCDHVVSPLAYIRESGWAGLLWVLPTYAVAAWLFALTTFQKAAGRASVIVMGGLLATLPVLAVLFAHDEARWPIWLYGGAAAVGAALLVRASRREGRERLAALIDVFAVAALPLAAVIFTLGKYIGAHLFGFAYVALATQRLLILLAKTPREVASQGLRIEADGDERVRVGHAELLEGVDESGSLEACAESSRS